MWFKMWTDSMHFINQKSDLSLKLINRGKIWAASLVHWEKMQTGK